MMIPEREQCLLDLQELSSLEVEPLDVLVYAPEPEQGRSLDTLTTTSDNPEVAALSTGALPVNDGSCCCCCTVACCSA